MNLAYVAPTETLKWRTFLFVFKARSVIVGRKAMSHILCRSRLVDRAGFKLVFSEWSFMGGVSDANFNLTNFNLNHEN